MTKIAIIACCFIAGMLGIAGFNESSPATMTAPTPQAHLYAKPVTTMGEMRMTTSPFPYMARFTSTKLKTGQTTLVRIVAPTVARANPGYGRVIYRIPTGVPYGTDQMQLRVFRSVLGEVDPISGAQRIYYLVHIPYRPNGLKGWVSSDRVVPVVTAWHVYVNLRTTRVTVKKNGVPVKAWKSVVGSRRTPTPRGEFAIYGRTTRDHPFDGTGIMTFAYSNVLKTFDGGNGKVALHGRAGASFRDPLGTARSSGCVRMDNAAIDWMLSRLPIGTPVTVV